MVRKLVRPPMDTSLRARKELGSRRKPPEASGAEASYLAGARDSGAVLVVCLRSGNELRGKLEFYDRQILKLVLQDGSRILLRREQINYYHAERG